MLHSMYPSIVRMRKDMFSVPCPACIHMDTNAGLDRARRHTQGMLREKWKHEPLGWTTSARRDCLPNAGPSKRVYRLTHEHKRVYTCACTYR